MSLYTELLGAGVPLDSHESDLYAKLTPDSVRIVEASGWRGVTKFTSHMEPAGVWYDLPFAFDPWWEARTGNGRAS